MFSSYKTISFKFNQRAFKKSLTDLDWYLQDGRYIMNDYCSVYVAKQVDSKLYLKNKSPRVLIYTNVWLNSYFVRHSENKEILLDLNHLLLMHSNCYSFKGFFNKILKALFELGKTTKVDYLDGLNIVALHSPDNKSDFAHWFLFYKSDEIFTVYDNNHNLGKGYEGDISLLNGLYDKYNGLFKQSNGVDLKICVSNLSLP